MTVIKKESELEGKLSQLINRLEAMAMVFMSGVGDEFLVFPSMAIPFCQIIESHCISFALTRDHTDSQKSFQNVFGLYHLWSTRLEKNKIKLKIEQLTLKNEHLPNKKINPIGS